MSKPQAFLKAYGAPLFLCAIFLRFTNLAVSNFIQDDGYITFHYADNLVNHGTLYYNAGEHGPYGYSNPGYVFILALLRIVSLKQISFEALSRIIASLSVGAILLMALKGTGAGSQTKAASPLSLLILFLFLVFPFFFSNVFSGLETPLLVFLLLPLSLSTKDAICRSVCSLFSSLDSIH